MTIGGDTLLYVGGSKVSFRCHCRCNVFRRVSEEELLKEGRPTDHKVFQCNACGDWYTAEEAQGVDRERTD